MRYAIAFLLAVATWTVPSFAQAQLKEKPKPIEIKNIRVGFRMYKEDDQTAYKAGLWAPIYIEIFGGTDGVAQKPGDRSPPFLEITTNDSEDVGTTIRLGPVSVEPLKTRTFIGYVKTGHYSGGANNREITVVLKVNGRDVKPLPYDPPWNVNIDAHVYLTLGPRIEDFHQAMKKMGRENNEKIKDDFRFNDPNTFYNVVYENDVDRLPERWFGYNGIDLMILSTDKRDFLTGLNNRPEQLKAIAQWVRRGGRLVVPISAQTQDAVNAVLSNPLAWQPPIPVVPPKASANLQLDRLMTVEGWCQVPVAPFQRSDPKKPRDFVPIPIATLDPGRVAPGDWEVEAQSDANTGSLPLIASVRYGLGKITYMAFSFQDESFFAWQDRDKFLQGMAKRLAPKAPANPQQRFNKFGGFDDGFGADPASQLLVELDKFGVAVIDFGWVALFIVLYILIVGPLDFFLLKYVFKRLEWTWITFPAVVLAVSVIAYFAAYALKGKDLKVNKVDIVDFDLRTSREQPRVYGHSFFTILSPRIQNYTVGLEPNPEFWGDKADKPKSVDLLSWMGRPSGGFNGMDRGGSGGFFRKPYDYTEDANGLRGVPIPVWTTKAFMASWEQPLAKPPFVVDLVWHKAGDVPITGKLENHLGVDLVDVWLIHGGRFYAVDGGLKSIKLGAVPGPINLAGGIDGGNWQNKNNANDDLSGESAASAQQTVLVKRLLFHDFFDGGHDQRNHLLRPLDLGWRIKDDQMFRQNDRRTHEWILFGRVRPPVGAAESLTNDPRSPLPTKLWLGDLPTEGRNRPTLSGRLNQDTYIRVLLPVRPADE